MSSIEKLLIRGIRSFSPDSQNVIEFYTPVTIIVGHNGAGKTTIIECLKYATTGDLPPNAKGGAFVHDPKLSSDTDVKAQIRLKFRNVKGQSMVVTRSMQSTLKKNSKLEQKSLEGLLVTNDPATGEQVSISTRCAELDSEIPLHLGVSRAVLENVIFCHQEESFWPLSEPSILKKKFDDIFAATRYTKALDNLKSIRKDLTTDLKLEIQKLEFLNSEREKARRVEANLSNCEGQIDECRQKVSSLDLQIEAVSAGIDRSADDLQALNSLIAETERLKHDLQVTKQAQIDMSSSLRTIMKEDDEQLMEMLNSLLEQLKGAQQTVTEFEEKRNSILSKIESLTRDYSLHCTKRGSLQAQVSGLLGKRADRNSLLLQLAEMFSIPTGMNSEIELMEAVGEKLQIQRERLIAMKSEINEEDVSRQSQIQVALSKQAGLEELRRSRRRQIDEAQESLLRIEEELLKQIQDAADLGDEFQEEMEIASEETDIAMSRGDQNGPLKELERQLIDFQRKRKEAELEQDRLQSELQKFNQMAESRARLSLKSTEITKKEEQIQRAWSEYIMMPGAISSTAIGQFDVIEREFEAIQRERTIKLKAAQEKSETALRNLSLSSSKLEHIRNQLIKRESDLKELQSKMTALNEPVELQIKKIELELNALREREAVAQSSKAVYGSFLDSIKCTETADCPLCEQSIGGTLKHQVEEKLAGLSDGTRIKSEINVRKTELEARLQTLLPLRPVQQEIDRLRSSELPELRAELSHLEETESTSRCISEETQLDANSLTVEERRAQLVKRKIDDGLRLTRELCGLQHERQGLLDKMSGGTGISIDPEIVEKSLFDAQATARKCVEAVEHLTREARQRETELMQREGRLRDRKEKLMKLKMQRTERERLSKSQEESKTTLERLQNDLQKIQSDLEASQAALKQARESREAWYRGSQERLEVAQSSLDAALIPFTQLDALQAEIERLEASGCDPKSLTDLEKLIGECEEKISRAQEDLQAHQQQASRSTKEAAEVQIKERCIRDNLRLRELGERDRGLQAQLSTRLTRLQGIDRASLQGSHAKAQMKRSDLMGERAGLVGELRQLEESANRLRSELTGDYAHVTSDWQKQIIRVQALQLGSDDLDKYSRALDQAIMKYHALKMNEINAIIRELWTSTYQGTDIDTIEIRADHEGSNVNGRCYNYRVVMKKGSVDLDMRGRSSAGQRVLTCLIIRLALAEVFGLYCGILALDEPTTNLDRENIHSLAASLANIIRTRRSQSNFQLILITHDEEFVQLLGREQCAEWYWRVFKDENMHSCIERQSINGVLE